MSNARVLAVIGTRSEAIKLAPVLRRLYTDQRFELRLVVTAQHRELLDEVLEEFALVPDHDLNLMQPGQDVFSLTARMLLSLRGVLEHEQPDVVLVQGGTTTCMTATLAASYAGVPVAHVEAGLRAQERSIPSPDEINSALVGRLAELHLAPTEKAHDNLISEGVDPRRVHVTGNTVVDALLGVHRRVHRLDPIAFRVELGEELVRQIDAKAGPLVLVSVRREDNFGRSMESLCRTLAQTAREHPDWNFVWPVHNNPNVWQPAYRYLGDVPGVHLIEPCGYRAFVWLMSASDVILTDSGSVQEAAPSLGRPVLLARTSTERPEGLGAGTARLVGTDSGRVRTALEELLESHEARASRRISANPYGDGMAAQRIVEALADFLAPIGGEALVGAA